jgi:putative ABC transport system ATP-binding protein
VSEPVLELDDVVRTFPGTPPVHAVRGVTIRIDAGDLVGLVGPSGSGKTTLLNLAAGLDQPTTGTVRIAGHPVAGLCDRRMAGLRAHHLGVVFQRFFLMPHQTVLDNVANGLMYRGVKPKVRRAAAQAAIERVGLTHRAASRAGLLSGGESQRVAIARAIIGNPAVVLADEPTGSLDTHNGDEILRLLTELNRDGATIVVITHNPTIAEAMRRQVELRDGAVVDDDGARSTVAS